MTAHRRSREATPQCTARDPCQRGSRSAQCRLQSRSQGRGRTCGGRSTWAASGASTARADAPARGRLWRRGAGRPTHAVSAKGHRDSTWTPVPVAPNASGTPASHLCSNVRPPSAAASTSRCLSSATKSSCRQTMSYLLAFVRKKCSITRNLRGEGADTARCGSAAGCSLRARPSGTGGADHRSEARPGTPAGRARSPVLAAPGEHGNAPHILQGQVAAARCADWDQRLAGVDPQRLRKGPRRALLTKQRTLMRPGSSPAAIATGARPSLRTVGSNKPCVSSKCGPPIRVQP